MRATQKAGAWRTQIRKASSGSLGARRRKPGQQGFDQPVLCPTVAITPECPAVEMVVRGDRVLPTDHQAGSTGRSASGCPAAESERLAERGNQEPGGPVPRRAMVRESQRTGLNRSTASAVLRPARLLLQESPASQPLERRLPTSPEASVPIPAARHGYATPWNPSDCAAHRLSARDEVCSAVPARRWSGEIQPHAGANARDDAHARQHGCARDDECGDGNGNAGARHRSPLTQGRSHANAAASLPHADGAGRDSSTLRPPPKR